MPNMEKFILLCGAKSGVLPWLPLKGLATTPAASPPEREPAPTPTASTER